jgi:hypothetical protein
MNTKLYTGNSSTQSITGVGFQPDFTWIKDRNDTGHHQLLDAVRGVTKYLSSNDTDAEATASNGLTAFNSDGFSLGDNTNYNNSSRIYASWNWKANGAGSSNTDGSITSTVSGNTTSGFSIVSYSGNSTSGATVGHSLGTAPSTIIVKVLNEGTYNWNVYHKSLGATKALKLNLTNAEQVTSARWNDTEPTSSVFSLGNAGEVNETGKNYIAYCFAEKTGYSKFGSYTGNGSTDGTFVYLGFKPAFVIIKRTDSGSSAGWLMFDNKRLGYNGGNSFLEANGNATESSAERIDILSNGFKNRSTTQVNNASGGSYIFMCFAEAPLVGGTGAGVPCTAR